MIPFDIHQHTNIEGFFTPRKDQENDSIQTEYDTKSLHTANTDDIPGSVPITILPEEEGKRLGFDGEVVGIIPTDYILTEIVEL